MYILPEPVSVSSDDYIMSVALDDGRTISVTLAWYPKLLHATVEAMLGSRRSLVDGCRAA
jgi:hypothetical protein